MLCSRLLLEKIRAVKCERFPSEGGMVPENLLEPRSSVERFSRLPISAGISPVMLNVRSRLFRFTSLPMLEGILPVSLLFLRLSNWRLGKELNSLGISPCSLLLSSKISIKRLQLESYGGI